MAKRYRYIPNRVIDTNGISDGATIYVYDTGTTTPVTLYSDEALSVEVSNPYTVAAGAAVPELYHNASGEVRVRVVQDDGTVISDDDPYDRPISGVELASDAVNEGAGLVGFDQSKAYASTTAGGRMVDLPSSLKAEPYYASAASDDTDALTALAASSDDEIRLEINQPLRLSSQVTFTDKQLSITGAGSAASKIICTDTGGIKFVSTATTETIASQHRFTVNGVSMVQDSSPAAGAGATAIEGVWNFTGSGSIERFTANDLTISGGGTGKWWNKGIRLVDCAQVRMSNIKIFNQDGHQTCLSPAAIELVRDNASSVTGFNLSNFWLGRFVNGLLISQESATVGAGTVEGHYISNGEIVNVAYAIHEDNTADAGVYYDSIRLANVHWNASRAGFKGGRVRSLESVNGLYFYQNFGETSSPAPLEAGINILLEAEGIGLHGNNFTRSDTITDDAPMLLLPDAADLLWVRVNDNQVANWEYLANVQSGGTLTETEEKFFIGRNRMIATPLLTGYGFRGNKTAIGGTETSVASGTVIDFGHEFATAPSVVVTPRLAPAGIAMSVSSVTTTGFTFYHDGAGGQNFNWQAVGL